MNTLMDLGVETVFGLPGMHNLPLWEVLPDSSLRVFDTRQAQSAAFAADGYARATGDLGVVFLNTGPGAANTISAMGEAAASASPVLTIATDVPSTLRRPGVRRGSLHETRDQEAVFHPVAKATFTVDCPESISSVVRHAAQLARQSPSGPVYVGIPADFLSSAVLGSADVEEIGPGLEPLPRPAAVEVDRARTLLAQAERPLIWCGGGAVRADAGQAIGKLAERLAAPIVTTFGARGIVPADHPCLAPYPVHLPEVGTLWDQADMVLAVGTDFDGIMTQNWRMPQPPHLITVNVDPADATKNYPPDVLLTGDAGEVTEHLLQGLSSRPGVELLRARLLDIGHRVRRRVRQEEPRAGDFLGALGEILPERSVLISDMCVAGHWVGGFYRAGSPHRLAYPTTWGTHGYGFPASVGAAAAGAERAVCVIGDGGFLHGCGELATVARENLPITVIIVNDGGYGMLRHEQARSGRHQHGVDQTNPDFVGLARSFGVYAEPVHGFGRAFRRLLGEFVRAEEPNVLVARATLAPPPTTPSRWYRR